MRESTFGILLENPTLDSGLKAIALKVLSAERISVDEGIYLFEKADLSYLGVLANHVREHKNKDLVYFNRNFHIEPTNLCVFTCKFCSYSRLLKQVDEGWVLDKEQMLDIVRSYQNKPVTEVHIVGGVHPKLTLDFFCDLLREIKAMRPGLQIKGFTAVEYDYMFRKAKLSSREGLTRMMEAGLESIPGGGAEIFDEKLRSEICGDKCSADVWLDIHRTAHELGLPSNATMLYGHIETFAHRIDHMNRLRDLQDITKGFNTFIPLKFRNKGNSMSYVAESTVIEDLRNYAVSRIFLDNFDHIKAYWPMIGRSTTQLSLAFGVDDIDGTIDDTTRIYSMAGAEDQHPGMNVQELVQLVKQVGRHPVERDTFYNIIADFSAYDFSLDLTLTPEQTN